MSLYDEILGYSAACGINENPNARVQDLLMILTAEAENLPPKSNAFRSRWEFCNECYNVLAELDLDAELTSLNDFLEIASALEPSYS